MPRSNFKDQAGIQVEGAARTSFLESIIEEVARGLPVLRPLLHYEHDHPLRLLCILILSMLSK